MGLRKSKSGFLLSDQWKNFKPAGGVFELLTDRAGATFHTVWGHRSCTTRKWRKNANYQFSLSNKDEEVVEMEGLMESLWGQGLKQVLWSIPTAWILVLVHCHTLHHGKDSRGTVREGNSITVSKSPKARYTCLCLWWGSLHKYQCNGMLALVQWFSIWCKMKLQNLRSQPNSWQKYSLSAMFCLLLQMQFSPKLGALVKWLGIIWVGRPHLVSHKSLVSTSAALCAAMFTKLVISNCAMFKCLCLCLNDKWPQEVKHFVELSEQIVSPWHFNPRDKFSSWQLSLLEPARGAAATLATKNNKVHIYFCFQQIIWACGDVLHK